MRLSTKIWFVNSVLTLLLAFLYAGNGRIEGFGWGILSAVYWKLGAAATDKEKENKNV